MSSNAIESEWRQLCLQVGRRAGRASEDDLHADERLVEANQFTCQSPPESYGDLVSRISAAEELLQKWDDQQQVDAQQEEVIDETVDESFPASDPPPWGGAHA